MLSKTATFQDSPNCPTTPKSEKFATVRPQPAFERQVRGATVEPTYGYASMTLPSGIVQPHASQGGLLRYPCYRIQSPQVLRQNSVPNSPCNPTGALPRLSSRTPQQSAQQQRAPMSNPYVTTATALSCIATPITQRQARYLRRELKQPQHQHVLSDETQKTPSSSTSSRDSGILSQDSSSSSQSFYTDDYHQMNGTGYSTPQCVARRAKQMVTKCPVEAQAVRFRGRGTGVTTNKSKMTKCAISESRLSQAPTNCISSPATPRASWNSSPGGVETEQGNVSSKVKSSTSLSSGTLERPPKTQMKQISAISASTATSVSYRKVQRPTNLGGGGGGGDKSPRLDKEIGRFGKMTNQSFKTDDFGLTERPLRNSSLPTGSERNNNNDNNNKKSHDSTSHPSTRAQTLSPPPQFASSQSVPTTTRDSLLLNPPNKEVTPGSSSTSTSTLAGNGSTPSLVKATSLNASSNTNDTLTFPNRPTSESRIPVASVTPQPTPTNTNITTTPQLVVESTELQEKGRQRIIVTTSPQSSGPIPRMGGAGEDRLHVNPAYDPLSRIKLPYSTPVMQRTQHQQTYNASTSTVYSTIPNNGKNITEDECFRGLQRSTENTALPISEAFGSQANLSSSGTTLSATAKLKRDLEIANQKVAALTYQLSANTRVVQAFEQSLQTLSQRLYQLTASSVVKEQEVRELRKIIDQIRHQPSQSDWSFAMENTRSRKKLSQSQEFVKSLHIMDSDILQQAGSLSNLVSSPHSVSGYTDVNQRVQEANCKGFTTPSYMPIRDSYDRNYKKVGWLRTSLSRAFRRSKSRDPPDSGRVTSTSAPHDPTQPSPSSGSSVRQSPTSSSGESPVAQSEASCIIGGGCGELPSSTADKDYMDSISHRHQLHTMHETVLRLQQQIQSLRMENARLQQIAYTSSSVPAALSGASTTGSTGLSVSETAAHKQRTCLNELFILNPEIGRRCIPVFVKLGFEDPNSSRLPSVQNHLLPPGEPSTPNGSPINRVRRHDSSCEGGNVAFGGENLPRLHLLGRIYLAQSGTTTAGEIRSKVKNLFRAYLEYLDSDEKLGLSPEGIFSISVIMTAGSSKSPSEFTLSAKVDENLTMSVEQSYEISRLVVRLHENVYLMEKPSPPSLLNPLSVSFLVWTSLISSPLICNIIESLLAHKCAIIYGPRGSGKLEFGSILIHSMAKMFPGFWSEEPNTLHYSLRATPNAPHELRQALLNGLLTLEGLVILRLPPALLPDLVNVLAELNFSAHPRKILLLIIMDVLTVPAKLTQLHNCPKMFPFLADVQSASAYMRLCLRQRLSQFAFQCLECSTPANILELDALLSIIEWLPEFWLRSIATPSASPPADESGGVVSTFMPFSPFHLIACPLNPSAAGFWFRDICEASGAFRRAIEANDDLERWLSSTWPWPTDEPSPGYQTSHGLHTDDSMTTSAMMMMMMYDSSTSLPVLMSTTPVREARLSGRAVDDGRFVQRLSPCPTIQR